MLFSKKLAPPFFAVGDVVLQDGGLPRAAPPPAAKKKETPPSLFFKFFLRILCFFFLFWQPGPGPVAPAARGRPPSRKTVAAKESVHRHKNKNPPPQKSQKNHRFALIFSKNTTRILWPPFREKFGKNFKNRQNRPEPLLHKKGKFGTVLNFFIRLSKSF